MSTRGFGVVLCELMEKRDVDAAALAKALAKQGYHEASEDALVGYVRGEREVDPRLPGFLARALGLDFEEKKVLALAFAFGQGRAAVPARKRLRGDGGGEAKKEEGLG